MCLFSNQTGRASEHARTAAPLTGATRHNGDTFFSRGSSSLSERERLSTKREPGRKSLKNHRATRKQRCASSVGPLDLPKPHLLLLYKARGGLGYHRIERPSSFGRLSLVRSHDKRARRWTRHATPSSFTDPDATYARGNARRCGVIDGGRSSHLAAAFRLDTRVYP